MTNTRTGRERFWGAHTALVTPFRTRAGREAGVDYGALRALVDWQIGQGIDGLVPCGTTGESPTLSPREHGLVIEAAVEQANGRVPVIAGTGSNCTREAITMTMHAHHAGADASLLVNPYYNKPTQEGLYRHFSSIAESVPDMPIIAYNIRGRTAVNIETPTLDRIARQNGNVIGVKEASGDIHQMRAVLQTLPSDFVVLSGDDGKTYALMAIGGRGVISVASNFIPAEIAQMVQHGLEGNMDQVRAAHERYSGLFGAEAGIFIETNPIPVKAAMAMMHQSNQGFPDIREVYRLPMCELSSHRDGVPHREILRGTMESLGFLRTG
ncbi:4-hydroxy-tetrahydrodipicolinate synthase [Candidatus Woesearchaeota archaeon]|nr:4-hydroxy-tetrahydrodipicolinate synthase [Candidatus Woesearchaeota archaeon]